MQLSYNITYTAMVWTSTQCYS